MTKSIVFCSAGRPKAPHLVSRAAKFFWIVQIPRFFAARQNKL
jgi:hypothetical protein